MSFVLPFLPCIGKWKGVSTLHTLDTAFSLWLGRESALCDEMKTALCLIFLSSMTMLCPAAEIVGWKVPLSRFVDGGLEADGIVRCKSSPEASPFFKEGDELWDLKGVSEGVRKETAPPLDWVIWNESTGRLVVKADWIGIYQIQGRLRVDRLPRLCRLTAEIFEVPADGSPLEEKSKRVSTISWLTHSDDEFDVSSNIKGQTFKAKGKVTLGTDSRELGLLVIDGSCVVKDQPLMNFRSGLVMHSNDSVWLVRDFNGKEGLDLRITSSVELLDGSSAEAIMLIQKNSIIEPFKVNRSEIKRQRIGDKEWFAIQYQDPQFLQTFSPSVIPSDDPFQESSRTADPILKHPLAKLDVVEVQAPDRIKSWFDRPVWDIGSLMKIAGVISDGSKAFAGYDPLSQRIFMLSDDERELDKFESLFELMCCLPPKLVVVNLNDEGQTRLVTRSGEIARVERVSCNQRIRSLEIEPTVGENNKILDTRFSYSNTSDLGVSRLISNVVMANSGQSLQLMDVTSGHEAPSSLSVTFEIEGAND